MAIKNVEINVKTGIGYDQLLPKNVASIVAYDNTISGLSSTNVQDALSEVYSRGSLYTDDLRLYFMGGFINEPQYQLK